MKDVSCQVIRFLTYTGECK